MIDFVQRVSFLLMCFVPDVQCSKAFPYDIGHYLRIYVNSVVAIVFFCLFRCNKLRIILLIIRMRDRHRPCEYPEKDWQKEPVLKKRTICDIYDW